MLNPAVVNAYVLYHEHKPQNTLKRRFFQRAVAINMIEALEQRRLSKSNLQRDLRITIRNIFPNLTSETTGDTIQLLPKTKFCGSCHPSFRKKTRYQCRKCGAPVCIDHYCLVCDNGQWSMVYCFI